VLSESLLDLIGSYSPYNNRPNRKQRTDIQNKQSANQKVFHVYADHSTKLSQYGDDNNVHNKQFK